MKFQVDLLFFTLILIGKYSLGGHFVHSLVQSFCSGFAELASVSREHLQEQIELHLRCCSPYFRVMLSFIYLVVANDVLSVMGPGQYFYLHFSLVVFFFL